MMLMKAQTYKSRSDILTYSFTYTLVSMPTFVTELNLVDQYNFTASPGNADIGGSFSIVIDVSDGYDILTLTIPVTVVVNEPPNLTAASLDNQISIASESKFPYF